MKKLMDLLKNKSFRRFFLVNIISYIGMNIGLIGINWHVVDKFSNNQSLAVYTTTSVLSTIFISFFISGFIDQYNKFLLMKYCIGMQSVALILIWFMIRNVSDSIYIYILLSIVNSSALAIYNIASRGAIKYTLEKENLVHGNSVLEICIQGGAIFASLLTGFLYKRLGYSAIFWIMIITLAGGAMLIKKVSYTRAQKQESYIGQIKEGAGFFRANRFIFLLGIVVFMPNVVTLASNNVLPGYIKQALNLDSVAFGIADTIFGIGAFISGIFIMGLIKKLEIKRAINIFFLLSALALGILAILVNINVLYIIYFIFGLSNTALKILLNTMLMEKIPSGKYGRCLAMCNSIASLMQILVIQGISFSMDNIHAIYGYAILSFLLFISWILYIVLFRCTDLKSEKSSLQKSS